MHFPRLFCIIPLVLLVSAIVIIYILQQQEQWLLSFAYYKLQTVEQRPPEDNKTEIVVSATRPALLVVKRRFKAINMQTFRQQQGKEFNESQLLLKNIHVLELQNSERLNDNWKLISITRHPVDRLLSGYVDKCIRKPVDYSYCNRCYGNLTCFLITEYERMMAEAPKKKMKRTFEFRRCNYHAFLRNYTFIRYENTASEMASNSSSSFLDKLSSILLQQNVSAKDVDFVTKELKSFRTVHSTADSDARSFFERRLLSSPFLMEFVQRMFYWDFKLFNYSTPQLSFYNT